MDSIKLVVSAGNHRRVNCPLSHDIPVEVINTLSGETYCLASEDGDVLPVQMQRSEGTGKISWILPKLEAGKEKLYVLRENRMTECGIDIIRDNLKAVISIDKQPFLSYVYDASFAKPYIGPIFGSHNQRYTRLDFSIKEHPHQRSLWMGIGDINGLDFWNETGEFGKQRQQDIIFETGSVMGVLSTKIVWTDFYGKPVMNETRKMTVYNMPSNGRYLDIESIFTATHGKVVFGPTKEAGPLGIRVAETMNVSKGGTMVNSYGAVGEEECWGKKAVWCDYSGMADGYLTGIAVFDHPTNDGYPTHWHIRNYGLFAPNNFYFAGGRILEEGESMSYRYRVFFHDGNAQDAKVAERYHDYITEPKVTFI